MFDFSDVQKVQSKLQPDVIFHVRTLNYLERMKRESELVEVRCRFSEIEGEKEKHATTYKTTTGETKTQIKNQGAYFRLHQEQEMLRCGTLIPAYIRHGLVKIEGLTLSGAPASVPAFLEHGPDDLIQEAFDACLAASELSGEEQKNSQSPGTSSTAETTGEKATTAVDASGSDTGVPEAA